MTYKFTITSNEYYETIGEIFFNFNNKDYKFIVKIYSPDCDDCCNNINSYYFHYEKKNEYGATLKYTEYVNCFENIALNKKTRLFGLDINKEFNCISNELKELFINLNNLIITKIKKYYNKFLNDNNNEIEEEIYYVDDIDCEGGHLNYKLCPKFKELFHKYNYDIKKISNIDNEVKQRFKKLEGDLSKYSIDFRGDAMGILVIDYSNYDKEDDINSIVQDIKITSLEELLELNVFIPTWNKYRWGEEEYTEEEIVKQIWLELL